MPLEIKKEFFFHFGCWSWLYNVVVCVIDYNGSYHVVNARTTRPIDNDKMVFGLDNAEWIVWIINHSWMCNVANVRTIRPIMHAKMVIRA